MKGQTTLSGSFRFLILIGVLMIGGFGFYVSLADFYGVSSIDHSSLNSTSTLTSLSEELKTQADSMAESNVGGFTIFEGGLSTLKVLVQLPNLIVGFVSDLSILLKIPIYIVSAIIAILIFDTIKDFVAIIWSKIRP